MQVDEEKCEIAALKAQILRLERQLATSKMVSQPPQAEQPGQSPQSPAPGHHRRIHVCQSHRSYHPKDVNKNYSLFIWYIVHISQKTLCLLKFFLLNLIQQEDGRRVNMAVDAVANVAVTDVVAEPLIISHLTKTYVSS